MILLLFFFVLSGKWVATDDSFGANPDILIIERMRGAGRSALTRRRWQL
jgi:hypothetical protein